MGGSVSSQVVIAAARGILTSLDKTKLQLFGGHINLTRHWAHSFLTRMNYAQRKGPQQRASFLRKILQREFLEDLRATMEIEEIPPELILNWD